MDSTQKKWIIKKFSPKLFGALLMLLYALSFSISMVFLKILSPDVNSFIVLFVRSLFGFFFFAPFILKVGIKGFITSQIALHTTRILCVILSMLCTFYAYRNLPLTIATSIGMTSPLFTVMISTILLKDKVSLSKWFLIILGYFGVIVIIRPHEIFVNTAIYVALIANFFTAFSIICVKLLSRTESIFTIMLYSNTVTLLISSFLACSVWTLPSFNDLMILIIVGGLGVVSQFCAITALKYTNPSFSAPFEYVSLCFAIVIGFIFFDEIPAFWIILGSIIIIVATYGLTLLGFKENKAQNP